MGHRHIALLLGPGKLDAALVVGGKIRSRAHIPLDPEQWKTCWTAGLVALDGPLSRAVQRVGAKPRTPCVLVVDTPGGFTEVGSFASLGDTAIHAAAARFRERPEAEMHSLEVSLLGGSAGVAEPRSVVLTIAERNSVLNELYAWCARSGLSLGGVLPKRAATLAATVRLSERRNAGREQRAVCFVGHTTSALVYRSTNGLQLVRGIEIGIEHFAEAYARAAQHAGEGDTNRGVDPIEQLFVTGVPSKRSHAHHGDEDTSLATVGPLLSPVLQRLTIEVKQSLKYGMDPADRPEGIDLVGIGAGVPGLAEALTIALEIDVVAATGRTGAPEAFSEVSAEYAVVTDPGVLRPLVPGAAVARDESRRIRRASVIAAGLAVAMVGGEYVLVSRQAEAVSAAYARLDPVARQLTAYRTDTAAVAEASARIASAVRLTEGELGTRPDWEATLLALGQVLGDDGRVREVQGEFDGNEARLHVEGETMPHGDPAAHMAALLDRVRGCPLVLTYELGGTAESSRDGAAVTEFSIVMRIVGFPVQRAEPGIPRISSAGGGGKP